MNILFLDKMNLVNGSVSVIASNLIQITGCDQNLSGFYLLNDAGNVYGKYEDFTTLYRVFDDGYILSNDGSVYEEPEPVPIMPETLEEVIESKVIEMNDTQQALIAQGVDVVLSNGSTEHFTLTEHDQTSLIGLQAQVMAGEENIPWHTSDEDKHCKFYSNEDMARITLKQWDMLHGT